MDSADDIDTLDQDLAALDMRRDRLRAFAGRVAEAIEAIDMPTSFIDAERAARCVAVADRMIVRSKPFPCPNATSKANAPPAAASPPTA